MSMWRYGKLPARWILTWTESDMIGEFVRTDTFGEVAEALSPPFSGYDGSSVTEFQHGGVTYRAKFWQEQDVFMDINDFDYYGKVEPVGRGMWPKRPDGFDGAARKVCDDHYDYWWQPPEGIGNDEEVLRGMTRTVSNLLQYGFVRWCLSVEQRCGCCGSYTIVGTYSYGGNEPFVEPDDGVIGEMLEAAFWEVEDL